MPGIKRNAVLSLSATVALLILLLTASRRHNYHRDTGNLATYRRLRKFSAYSAFVLPSSFNFRLYLPREYERWIFATKAPRVQTIAIGILTVLIAVASIVVFAAIHLLILREIWQHPTLGGWSYFALAYIGAAYLLNLLILFRRSLPFPFKDKSSLRTRP